MEVSEWRKVILEHLADDEDVSVDGLHEAAEGEDDLGRAMGAVEDLEREGLAWDDHGVIKPRVGKAAEINHGMEREKMTGAINDYAERNDMTPGELRAFVADVTGRWNDDAIDELIPRLTPSELELVHDVVASHNEWNSRRAS